MLNPTCWQAWLPDSPRWLLFSGAPREQVFTSLSRCRGMYSSEEATEKELASMNATASEGPPAEGGAHLGLLLCSLELPAAPDLFCLRQ